MGKILPGGSSANPPHLAHKELARSLLAIPDVEKVIWIPCGIREEKSYPVTPEQRKIMTEMTFADFASEKRFIINYMNIGEKNVTTLEWMKYYKEIFPNKDLSWFTGSDLVIPNKKHGFFPDGRMKCEIDIWDGGEELLRDYKILALTRKGYEDVDGEILHPSISTMQVDLPKISSSEIRAMLAGGCMTAEKYLDTEVFKYIIENKLYL